MSKAEKFKLTISITFLSENDMELALAIFKSWCENQDVTNKTYGIIKTGRLSATLFLVSPAFFKTWTLNSLFESIQLSGNVSVTNSSSTKIK